MPFYYVSRIPGRVHHDAADIGMYRGFEIMKGVERVVQ